jgi:chemotaxis response regulator CheB
MGRDGADGLGALRTLGAHTIAQNEATCAVYGMPRAAVELNAACQVLAIDEIPATLSRLFV